MLTPGLLLLSFRHSCCIVPEKRVSGDLNVMGHLSDLLRVRVTAHSVNPSTEDIDDFTPCATLNGPPDLVKAHARMYVSTRPTCGRTLEVGWTETTDNCVTVTLDTWLLH